MVGCIFDQSWWNDPEQRNYILHECINPENEGGEIKPSADYHGKRTYSYWHKNERMAYRCWGKSDRINDCPMALTKSTPEISCEVFVQEEVHPSESLVSKEKLRERFYQNNLICISCGNCLEESCKE